MRDDFYKEDVVVQLDSASAMASSFDDEESITKCGCWLTASTFFMRLFAPAINRCIREGDDEETKVRKTMAMIACIILTALQPIFLFFSYREGDYMVASCTLMRTIVIAVMMVYCLVTRTMSTLATEVTCILFGVIFSFATDVADFGLRDQWISILIISDAMLILNCRPAASVALIVITCLFITAKTFEEGVGLGVYNNIPSSWSTSEPRDTQGARWAVIVVLVRVLILLADTFLTFKFASGMREAERKSKNAVLLAKKVAEALVRFDLELAECSLRNAEETDKDELHEIFEELIGNLKMYKPYLPDALFTRASSSDEVERHTFDHQARSFVVRNIAPGGHSNEVTIAFTDIQSSTDIWEKHTSGMRAAMEHHNDIMREAITEANGYEVKTIGDAFMVAFDTACEAFIYGLRSQVMLYEAQWPNQILDHPLCKKTEGLWNGLRVRIGIHTGPVKLELNPTTGRTDYMGPTVNKAARVESASAGGAVAYTEEAWEAVSESDIPKLKQPLIKNIGMQTLKGVGKVPIFIAIPKALAARIVEVEKTIRKRNNQKRSPPSLTGSVKSTMVPVSETGTRVHTIQKNKLQSMNGSVVCLRASYEGYTKTLSSPVDAINDLVTSVLDACERTEGLTCSICSSSIVLSFNCGKPCPMHVSQSAKFVSHFYATIRGSQWERLVTAGLTNGDVLHGMLGSIKQRFATLFGEAVEMGRALADSAAQLGTFCLLSGTVDRSIQLHTRPVDRWLPNSGPAKIISELNMKTFSQVQGVWNIFDGTIPPEWSKLYCDAFHAEDTDAVQGLIANLDQDRVTPNIIKVMQGRLVLTKPLVVDTASPLVLQDGLLAVGPTPVGAFC
eukprot:TRINITY_DN13247_c0_g3_i1.p1 TRINITY_DN13247_c0_g3~~TRINITY_DN13247_c0_g3_i1.p1  ORF type:complete len:848 (+),score=149.03 TRINITY_DN13247_c0_g3_i1:54-2597(+)